VTAGAVERVGRGHYALPALPSPLKSAAALRGVVSHASAARLWNLETIGKPAAVHVTVPARSSRRHPGKGVTLHYGTVEDDRVTAPLRTVLDCARTLPFREGLAIADSALRVGLVSADELDRAAYRTPGRGSGSLRKVARWASPQAANAFESALRAIAIEAGLTGFVPQLLIRDGALAWRVDLGEPRLHLVLEADSFAFHGARADLERDCRRYDNLVSRGWTVLRYSWEQVMFDSPWVETTLVATHRRLAATHARLSNRPTG
jgi:very-short-patch-repair endonuclease